MAGRKGLGRSRVCAEFALTIAMILLGFAVTASAEPGKCVLRVDGHNYINGPCDINLERGGDFQITSLGNAYPYYFAYVYLEGSSPGHATGAWNDKDGESHAGDDLGTLTRKGACWSNTRAKICAVAK
jgi:hypothetical protein